MLLLLFCIPQSRSYFVTGLLLYYVLYCASSVHHIICMLHGESFSIVHKWINGYSIQSCSLADIFCNVHVNFHVTSTTATAQFLVNCVYLFSNWHWTDQMHCLLIWNTRPQEPWDFNFRLPLIQFPSTLPSSLQFFLQFHFRMEKMTPLPGGPVPPMGVKRPPPLMSSMDPRPPNDHPMPPPPPGGMRMPPLPPGAPGPPPMPHQMRGHHGMPPMPPMMRPPLPTGGPGRMPPPPSNWWGHWGIGKCPCLAMPIGITLSPNFILSFQV